MRWSDDGIIYTMDMSLKKFGEIVKDRESGMCQSMESQRIRHDKPSNKC